MLGVGIVLSLLSLAAGLALVTLSGAAIAAMYAAVLLGAPLWLKIAGPARVVLRYLERLATHSATFRALADLRIWFFRGLARSSAGGLGFRRSGDLLSSLVADVEALDGLYLRILVPLGRCGAGNSGGGDRDRARSASCWGCWWQHCSRWRRSACRCWRRGSRCGRGRRWHRRHPGFGWRRSMR